MDNRTSKSKFVCWFAGNNFKGQQWFRGPRKGQYKQRTTHFNVEFVWCTPTELEDRRGLDDQIKAQTEAQNKQSKKLKKELDEVKKKLEEQQYMMQEKTKNQFKEQIASKFSEDIKRLQAKVRKLAQDNQNSSLKTKQCNWKTKARCSGSTE